MLKRRGFSRRLCCYCSESQWRFDSIELLATPTGLATLDPAAYNPSGDCENFHDTAPMLKLPTFSSSDLLLVSVCLHIGRDDDDDLQLEDSLTCALVDAEQEIYACRTIDVAKSYWHYHLDVGFEDYVST